MGLRPAVIVAILATALVGCDGKDPDRLNRVGKKLVEKGQNVAEEAHLPRVKIEVPVDKTSDNAEPKAENEKQPGNGEPKPEN